MWRVFEASPNFWENCHQLLNFSRIEFCFATFFISIFNLDLLTTNVIKTNHFQAQHIKKKTTSVTYYIVKGLATTTQYRQRLIRESLEIMKNPSIFNREERYNGSRIILQNRRRNHNTNEWRRHFVYNKTQRVTTLVIRNLLKTLFSCSAKRQVKIFLVTTPKRLQQKGKKKIWIWIYRKFESIAIFDVSKWIFTKSARSIILYC